MSTDLEVLAEGLGADGALQFGAEALAAAGQRHLWYRVTGGRLAVVAQQFVLAAELRVTHVAGEELHADVGERVGDAGVPVRQRGPAHSAEPQLRQVGLRVSPDGIRVRREKHLAGFARQHVPRHLEEGGGGGESERAFVESRTVAFT